MGVLSRAHGSAESVKGGKVEPVGAPTPRRPTPIASGPTTFTPTPAPSETPAATTRSLVVAGDRHLVELTSFKAFGTSPFTIAEITTEA